MKQVVVVGRDAPLWLAVLALRRALGPAGVSVRAVELPTALAAADVYPTLPPIEALHARIGVDEAALLRATGGAFSLGTHLTGPGVAPFFLGWGSHGAPVDGAPFFPAWVKARRHGLDARLQDFSLTAVAAMNGRLLFPDEATIGFGRTDYAYSLPARAYVGVLKGAAARLGIETYPAPEIGVELDDATGEIAAVQLGGDIRLDADLFVDASGGAALLAEAMGNRRRPREDEAAATRRLVARAPGLRSPPPYIEQRAEGSGWLRLHSTRDDMRIVKTYSGLLSDDRALAEAEAALGVRLADPSIVPVDTGGRERAWQGNCVAIGAAAHAVDPVLGIDLHVAQLGIVHLLSLFPASDNAAAERAEYNRVIASSVDRLRDAQQAVHALAPWQGAFWDLARQTPCSPEFIHRIATFRARGEIAPIEDDAFDADFWQALFVGMGVMPESWPPPVDRVEPEAMKAAFRHMFGFIRDKVLEQPTHDDHLADSIGRPSA